jgi:putative oxidoreductase
MHPLLNTARRLHRIQICLLDMLRDVLFLVIRLYFGYRLMVSGQAKLANPIETAAYFRDLHIPFPEPNVYLAGAAELFGGLFLAIGLASRIAAIPVIATMLVAYVTAHAEQWAALYANTPLFFKAPPFPYLFTAAVVLVCGPGRLSLDHLIGWYFDRPDRSGTPPTV